MGAPTTRADCRWEGEELPRGTLQYQMDTGVRLTLPKAGAFGENTVSKNEGSLGEKPNFGLKWGGGIG